MKKIYSLFILIFILMMTVSCKNNQIPQTNTYPDGTFSQTAQEEENNQTNYPLAITDKFSNEVTIISEPKRVISFSPELVEIMYAIGAGDKLIGRSSYCDYPEQTADIPDMGDLFNLNIEAIVEANPDVVFLSSMASEDIANSLKDKGLTVVTLDADTNVNGVYTYIESMGAILNRTNEAKKLTEQMKSEISEVENKIAGLNKPKAYFVVGIGQYESGATGDTFIGQLMEMAGAVNVAADGSNWMYNIEQLIDNEPDLLICSKYGDMKAAIESQDGYKDLTAVKNGEIYEADENIFYRQGPRMVEAIKVLAKIFHPEVFE